jgi:hypothetical protein
MIWIERIAVDIAAALISTQFLAALWPAMATGAKTLERVKPKSIDVISMRNDVINASCRPTDAMLLAHLAKWLNK